VPFKSPPPLFVDDFTHAIISKHTEHAHDCHSPVHEAPITNTLVEALKSLGDSIITNDSYRVTNSAFKHVLYKIFEANELSFDKTACIESHYNNF
jgi:hypothetical protein